MMTMTTRRYGELVQIPLFDDRYEYLKLGGSVGYSTFGYDRWINQRFYNSYEWKQVRNEVLVRDDGLDLGVPGYEIRGKPIVHHLNPMAPHDIAHSEQWIINPEYLITTCHNTHQAIHYGDKGMLPRKYVERKSGDTDLWRPLREVSNGS